MPASSISISVNFREVRAEYKLQQTTKKDIQYTYNVIVKARWHNYSCIGKVISITYSECVSVAKVIQRAKRMRFILLPTVNCLVLPYLLYYSVNCTIFGGKNVIEREMCKV